MERKKEDRVGRSSTKKKKNPSRGLFCLSSYTNPIFTVSVDEITTGVTAKRRITSKELTGVAEEYRQARHVAHVGKRAFQL